MAFVELDRLTKRYGKVTVVNGVDLAIEKGTLVCLLGPSGCGKPTTLRLIAGFLEPSGGEIHVGADPESALRGTNAKFERRFAYIERALSANGRSLEEATLEEMDALWNEAKGAEQSLSSSRPSEARAGTHTAESRNKARS